MNFRVNSESQWQHLYFFSFTGRDFSIGATTGLISFLLFAGGMMMSSSLSPINTAAAADVPLISILALLLLLFCSQ